MSRLALNKSSLARQLKKLKLYKDVLPSMDLKRRQLLATQAKARIALKTIENELEEIEAIVQEQLPMYANVLIELDNLVNVENVEIKDENIVGIRVPKIERIELSVREYAFLGKPHWVDSLVELLKRSIETSLRARVARRRLELLDKATITYTQRFNLFDKVLIPRTESNIKKIRIYLSDHERAALVNAKIAKKKRVEMQ